MHIKNLSAMGFIKNLAKVISVVVMPSWAHAAQDLSQGQFYYGLELGTVRLGIADRAESPAESYSDLAAVKLTFGTFYASGQIDSYISIPFKTRVSLGDVTGKFSPGIEGGYRFYFSPLAESGHSAFLGAALSFPNYEFRSSFGKGIKKYDIAAPMTLGYGFLTSYGQIDIGARYVFGQDGDYYFSPQHQGYVFAETQEFFINYKKLTDYHSTGTSAGVGVGSVHSGFVPFVGFAPSAAWFTQGSDADNPEKHLNASRHGVLFSEYSAGFVIRPSRYHPNRRFIVQASYRPIEVDLQSYHQRVSYSLDSRAVEFLASPMKIFGLAPFFGVGLNHHQMQFIDSRQQILRGREQNLSAIVGWDILLESARHFHVRFTLRHSPELILQTRGRAVKFPDTEVNYINLIWQF